MSANDDCHKKMWDRVREKRDVQVSTIFTGLKKDLSDEVAFEQGPEW